jgi:hypothetical protein
MVESIYFLKPAWCGTHPAGLWPEQGLQPVTGATALRRWFLTAGRKARYVRIISPTRFRSRLDLARSFARPNLLAFVLRFHPCFGQRAGVLYTRRGHPRRSGDFCTRCRPRNFATRRRAPSWSSRIGLPAGSFFRAARRGHLLWLRWRCNRFASNSRLTTAGVCSCLLYRSRTWRRGRHHGVPHEPLFRARLLRYDLWFHFCRLRCGRRVGCVSDGCRLRCDWFLCLSARFVQHRNVNRCRAHNAPRTIPVPDQTTW